MKLLLVFVLRLLLQLILFAVTGRWHELGETAQPAPRKGHGGRGRARTFHADGNAARTRASRVEEARSGFADEGTYRDPQAAVREGGRKRAKAVRDARAARPSVPATSLGAALRDPRMLRDALILDAALGARGRKHRP